MAGRQGCLVRTLIELGYALLAVVLIVNINDEWASNNPFAAASLFFVAAALLAPLDSLLRYWLEKRDTGRKSPLQDSSGAAQGYHYEAPASPPPTITNPVVPDRHAELFVSRLGGCITVVGVWIIVWAWIILHIWDVPPLGEVLILFVVPLLTGVALLKFEPTRIRIVKWLHGGEVPPELRKR